MSSWETIGGEADKTGETLAPSTAPLSAPKFSLRTLFFVTTAIAVALGLTWWVSPLVLTGLAMASIAVGAHVAGNAIGTRLRDSASRPSQRDPLIDRIATPNLLSGERLPTGHTLPTHWPGWNNAPMPVTRLGQRWSLGWLMIAPTAAGTLASMIAGCCWMRAIYGSGFDAYGLAIAALAFGMLGGFATFLVVAFVHVTTVALWQALKQK